MVDASGVCTAHGVSLEKYYNNKLPRMCVCVLNYGKQYGSAKKKQTKARECLVRLWVIKPADSSASAILRNRFTS